MIQAPRSVAILVPVAPGDRGAWRRANPTYPAPRKSRWPDWPTRQAIPQVDREALRRSVEETLRATRRQREELRAAGLALLAA
jgi:hypothetical protein